MERQQERWLLEWLLVVSRVAVGALFVMTVGAAVVERLLERLLVVASGCWSAVCKGCWSGCWSG